MKTAFLDTSYLIALETADDQHQQAAQNHWQPFLQQKPQLVTTSYVFDEVVTFFKSRNRHAKAVEIGRRLLQSPSVQVIHVDEGLFAAGWAYFQDRADKRYSLTDCISFVVMDQKNIEIALSFDHHFEQAGFEIQPARSS